MSKGKKISPALVKFLIILAVFLVIILLAYIALILIDDAPWFMLVLWIFWGIFGWRTLNRIRPSYFLFLPIIGWVLFFIVKGLLSVVIGVFVAPFVIANGITKAMKI